MESTDTSTSVAGVGPTPAAAAAVAPTLSRKELLDQYRRNKAAGNTSEGLQSKIQSLKAGSIASGTKRPVAARTPVTKTSIDRAKVQQAVQQAGDRAVAPGTPVHALQKRLKLTSSSNAGSTGRPACAVSKSSSSLFGSTAATDVKKQPLSKAQTSDRVKVHRTALAPATTNTIAVECGPSAMTAGPVKPVGSRAVAPSAKAVLLKAKELMAWVEEANQLVKLGFVQAARALLEGLGPDARTTGKALYWLARAKIEEEQGDWERASDLLEEGRSHITERSGASSLDAVMMKEAIAEFKTRRTAAAVKEVDGLLDDSPQGQPSDHPSVLPPPPPSAVDFHDTRAPAPIPLAHDTNDGYNYLAHDGSMSAAESPPGAVKGFDSGEGEARLDYGRIGKALETHMSTLGLKSPAAKALRRMAESGATSSIKDDARATDSNGDSAAASEGGCSTGDATDNTHRVFRAGHVSKLRQMLEKGALTGAVALPGMTQLSKADRNKCEGTSTDSSSSSPPVFSCANLSKRLEDAQLDSSDGRGPRRESDSDAVLSRYLFDDSGDDDATVGASSEEEEDNVVSAARTKNSADGAAAHARVGRVRDRGGDTPARPKTATTPPVAASASRPMALSSPGLLSGGGARRIAVESKSLGNEAPHKLSEEVSRENLTLVSAVTGTSSFTARTGGASGATKPPAGNTRTRAAVSFSEAATTSSAFLMPPPPAKPLSCASITATTKTTGTFTHTSSPTTTRTGRARAAKRAPTPFKPPAATPTTPTDPHADNTDVHTGTPDSDHTTSGNRAVQGDGGGGGVRGDGSGVAGGVHVGGGSALVGAYEQDRESGKRRATPMPSKRRTTNNKQVATDAAGVTYMTEVTMKTKDGALTTTPVRRSSRLTQTPTPTPIRRNIERMLVTPVDSSMDSGGVEVPEIPRKAGRGAGWWLDS